MKPDFNLFFEFPPFLRLSHCSPQFVLGSLRPANRHGRRWSCTWATRIRLKLCEIWNWNVLAFPAENPIQKQRENSFYHFKTSLILNYAPGHLLKEELMKIRLPRFWDWGATWQCRCTAADRRGDFASACRRRVAGCWNEEGRSGENRENLAEKKMATIGRPEKCTFSKFGEKHFIHHEQSRWEPFRNPRQFVNCHSNAEK